MNPLLPIRIVIADDHEMIRNGFRNILQNQYPGEIDFVGEAKNGKELVDAADNLQPQLVLTDIQMPVMDGIEACRIIKEKNPAVHILAFSMFTDTNHIMALLRAGANGYLAKTSSSGDIISAIRSVGSGKPYYCSTVSEILYGKVNTHTDGMHKSKKIVFGAQEQKVMQLICKQHSTKEIAAGMKLAVRTVENYRYNIQEKIGARNMVGIALYAVINEIVKIADL